MVKDSNCELFLNNNSKSNPKMCSQIANENGFKYSDEYSDLVSLLNKEIKNLKNENKVLKEKIKCLNLKD